MTEVTNKNYQTLYPTVEKCLKDASYIAIDLEFTGINSSDDFKLSLFDSMKERYSQIRENIRSFIIIQFGITAYCRTPMRNEYTTDTFNFYLVPRSIPLKNRQFLWQVSALEFLSSYNFDFNKVFYDGIPYLNKEEEALLKKQIQDDELFYNLEQCVSYKEEDVVKDYVHKVADWLAKSSIKNENTFIIETVTPTLQYLAHKELRRRFTNIWTMSDNNSIIVMLIEPTLRSTLEQGEGQILGNVLLESYIGFSKVFKLLISLQKPIIGHNVFLDLMYIHQQFYKPLPKQYTDFKDNIHKLFPIVYDTKFLSYKLREMLCKDEKWKGNSLRDLYLYFNEGKGKCLILNMPSIKRNEAKGEDTENYHEAGWDSYVTGYIFAKMAYVFAVKKFGNGLETRILTNKEVESGISHFANCLNVIRGSISYLKLDDNDPPSLQAQWFYVKPLTSSTLSINQIAEKFSSFGTVDVKPFSQKRALVAVANPGSAWDIIQHFRRNEELFVTPYNPLRHSRPAKFCMWGGVILSGGMVVWMLHRRFQKNF